MSVMKLIDAVLAEHIGNVLTLELAAKLSVQLVEGILMSREGAGMPLTPGKSTNLEVKKSEKGQKIIMATGEQEKEPEPESVVPKLAKELEPPLPRVKVIESRPFEGYDESRDPEDQPDTMPVTIRRGRKP